MFSPIIDLINQIDTSSISDHRKDLLKPLHDYLALKIKHKKAINLNFICTHNSRRSQLSQVWAKVIADFYGININSFSGGIEITACNKRTIASLNQMGFMVNDPSGENPHYELIYHSKKPIISLFSKMHNDPLNPKGNYAAVMTCNHADKNCPFIAGAEKRISLPYEDPKAYDDSADEAKVYNQRSIQIAQEMKFIFSKFSD